MIESTMQDFPLTIAAVLRHGRRSTPTASASPGPRRRPAGHLRRGRRRTRSGSRPRSRGSASQPATGSARSCGTRQEHLEAYLAIPSHGRGAAHAEHPAVPRAARVRDQPRRGQGRSSSTTRSSRCWPRSSPELTTVERSSWSATATRRRSVGDRRRDRCATTSSSPPSRAEFEWPEIDERQAAAMCYTSGTTGNPKGVAYSHRSSFLHSLAATTPTALGLSERDRILMIVPMFHAERVGHPVRRVPVRRALVMPGRFLQAEPLTRMVKEERVTFSGAVPTIWADILRYGEEHEIDLSSLRMIICGGSAVPRSLMENFEERYGVRIVQGWGMTETSPLAAVAHPPASVELGCAEEMDWRAKHRSGRVGGVELRIVDDRGNPLPWDDEAVGEIEVRGPWITGSYYRDPSPEKFDDGWLRTGDVGTVTPTGFIQITDRAKDVIKSGGEWISSVELENLLMGHPDVVEASVIGVPDPRWDERPLACVVRKAGSTVDAAALAEFLGEQRREVAGARALELHRRGAEDVGRQVRQEGAARPAREGRARRRDAGLRRTAHRRAVRRERTTSQGCRAARPSGVEAAPAATVVLLRDGDDGPRGAARAPVVEARVPRRRVGVPRRSHRSRRLRRRPRRSRRGRAPRRGARGEGRSGRRRRPRRARPPLQLDDARDLAEAVRDLVLRRPGRRRRRGRRRLRDGRVQWFRPDEALAARAAGEIELAPPQYVTLLDLRDVRDRRRRDAGDRGGRGRSTTCRASTSSKAAARCASTPRTSRTTTSARLDAPARATASTSRDDGWEYVRD